MKNLYTFEEFLNESINPVYKGKEVIDKLSDGTKIEIYRNNMLEDDGKSSLGVKANFAESDSPWIGNKAIKYILYKILSGPNKESLLFCEKLFTKKENEKIGGYTTDSTENWYSEDPKTYSFKNVRIDAMKIPSNLKSKYDEFVKILNK